MANLLSGCLSNKGKPVICNGKLLRSGNKMVYARESANYSVIFTTAAKSNTSATVGEVNLTTGEGVKLTDEEGFKPLTEKSVISAVLDFDRQYSHIWFRDPEDVTVEDLNIDIDPFTNALIIESELYRKMMDPQEFHRIDMNYDGDGRKLRAKLLLDYIEDYYVTYSYLFHNKLMGTRSPAFIKGHLVAGLFQPLYCGTRFIPSPLDYPIFTGFRSIIHGDAMGINDGLGNIEVNLEPRENIDRGLILSCVSTYDIVHRFAPADAEKAKLYVPKGLDRRVFMFILLRVLSNQISQGTGLSVPLNTKHPSRTAEIKDNPAYMTFLYNLAKGYDDRRSQIAVR